MLGRIKVLGRVLDEELAGVPVEELLERQVESVGLSAVVCFPQDFDNPFRTTNKPHEPYARWDSNEQKDFVVQRGRVIRRWVRQPVVIRAKSGIKGSQVLHKILRCCIPHFQKYRNSEKYRRYLIGIFLRPQLFEKLGDERTNTSQRTATKRRRHVMNDIAPRGK